MSSTHSRKTCPATAVVFKSGSSTKVGSANVCHSTFDEQVCVRTELESERARLKEVEQTLLGRLAVLEADFKTKQKESDAIALHSKNRDQNVDQKLSKFVCFSSNAVRVVADVAHFVQTAARSAAEGERAEDDAEGVDGVTATSGGGEREGHRHAAQEFKAAKSVHFYQIGPGREIEVVQYIYMYTYPFSRRRD